MASYYISNRNKQSTVVWEKFSVKNFLSKAWCNEN